MSRHRRVRLAGEPVTLTPEGALYWPRGRTLVVADLHWGKAASFRAAALPLPSGTTSAGLERLERALASTRPARLLVLGDLFHARPGRQSASTLRVLRAWRARHAELMIGLVRGNHDRRAGDPPADLDVTCVDEPLVEPPFTFLHIPRPAPGCYALAGHVHPAVRLRGRGRSTERLACFWFTREVGILPAFGSFTGGHTITPGHGDRVFVLTPDDVVRVG